jgi:predicted acetyltransferase
MEINVRTAKMREQQIVENLMQLYLHDFSEFEDLQIQEDGQYAYEYLEQYWQNSNRYPFLFRADNQIAGFALLRYDVDFRSMQDRMEMIEFFVVRSFRRQGVGRAAAARLWDLFPGRWSLRVLTANTGGLAFWRATIADYTRGKFDEHKEEGMVSRAVNFSFDSNTPRVPEEEIPPDPVDY